MFQVKSLPADTVQKVGAYFSINKRNAVFVAFDAETHLFSTNRGPLN